MKKLWIVFAALAAAIQAEEALTPTAQVEAQPLSESAEAAIEADAYTVKGDKPDSTAGKLPATLKETPRSLNIVGEERIRERGFSNLNSTFNYVPGVYQAGQNRESYHFHSRGFRMVAEDTRVDGFPGGTVGGSFSQSLFGIERVIYLRGPAGLLYGAATFPGAMLNMVTKRPKEAFEARLDQRTGTFMGQGVGFGSRGSIGVDFDATGPLGDDGRLLYRLLYMNENQDSFINDGLRRSQQAMLRLAYKVDADTTFTPLLQTSRMWVPSVSGLISPSTSQSLADGKPGPIYTSDLNSFNVNLNAGGRNDEQFVAGFDLEHRLAERLSFNNSYRYRTNDSDINQYTVQAATLTQTASGAWQVSRAQAKSLTKRWSHNADLNLVHEHDLGPATRNLAQVGANTYMNGVDRQDSAPTQPNQAPIDIYSGRSGAVIVDGAVMSNKLPSTSNNFWNVYAQDQLSLDSGRWVATLGLGYGEQVFDANYSLVSPTSNLAPSNVGAVLAPRLGRLTPNLALLYNASKEAAVYASYATSYSPAPGDAEDVNGKSGIFEPQAGVNYEAGVKLEGGPLSSLLLSYFWIEQQGLLVQSPAGVFNANGRRYYTQSLAGGVQSQGIDLSAELSLMPDWKLALGGNWTEAFNRGTAGNLNIAGEPAEQTPKFSLQAETRYDIGGFGMSLGYIWQAERLSVTRTYAAPDPLVLPAFGRVDLGLFYDPGKRLSFALNIDNLCDELIFASSNGMGSLLDAAPPRSLSLRMTYKL